MDPDEKHTPDESETPTPLEQYEERVEEGITSIMDPPKEED